MWYWPMYLEPRNLSIVYSCYIVWWLNSCHYCFFLFFYKDCFCIKGWYVIKQRNQTKCCHLIPGDERSWEMFYFLTLLRYFNWLFKKGLVLYCYIEEKKLQNFNYFWASLVGSKPQKWSLNDLWTQTASFCI